MGILRIKGADHIHSFTHSTEILPLPEEVIVKHENPFSFMPVFWVLREKAGMRWYKYPFSLREKAGMRGY
jgi:hypothetical protein